MIEDPSLIEKTSFEIIARELGRPLPAREAPVITRVIHATADFEYASCLEFHPDAVTRGCAALAAGTRIYADTAMIAAGTGNRLLSQHGCAIVTLVADDDVAAEAASRGTTRSRVAMERAIADPGTRIFVVGNAPTALDALVGAIGKGLVLPDLVIGVPVGFVGAAESKEALRGAGVPYIITRGRKGGSTVAVAILNALLRL